MSPPELVEYLEGIQAQQLRLGDDPEAEDAEALATVERLIAVADLARDGIAGVESGDLDFEGFVDQLQATLDELDRGATP